MSRGESLVPRPSIGARKVAFQNFPSLKAECPRGCHLRKNIRIFVPNHTLIVALFLTNVQNRQHNETLF